MKPQIGSEVNCEFLFSHERSEMTMTMWLHSSVGRASHRYRGGQAGSLNAASQDFRQENRNVYNIASNLNGIFRMIGKAT